MDWQTTLHWLYVAAMAVGALYFWRLSRDPKGVPQHEYLVAILIPVWSGLAYLAMAVGQGKVEAAGQIVHVARYVDWIVTTPLLLLALAWTAMYKVQKNGTLIGFLMGTQVIVIVTGLIADLSERGWVRYLWYICGMAAFLVVLWGIWTPLRALAHNQGQELAKLYDRLLTYFTVLWIGYPIAWIIGPSGFGWVNQDVDTLLFCVLPFFSKVGFSFLDLNGLRRLQNRTSATGAERFTDQALNFAGSLTAWLPKRSRTRSPRRRRPLIR